jgi:hypothetical protein
MQGKVINFSTVAADVLTDNKVEMEKLAAQKLAHADMRCVTHYKTQDAKHAQ